MAMLPPHDRDRLQPALLDRLTEDPRAAGDADDQRFVTKAALRKAVVRDLGWLLNAVQPLSDGEIQHHPQAARSVLNFGLPALAGQLASKIDVARLERSIRQALIDFEPRIGGDSITVTAVEAEDVLSTHNVIEFEIRGWLWAQPVPLELMLRTQLDLEAGKVELRDLSPGSARTPVGDAL